MQYSDIQTAMLQKEKVWWKCLVGGAAKWKDGMVLQMQHHDPNFSLTATIVERNTNAFIIEFNWDTPLSFAEVLQYTGKVPCRHTSTVMLNKVTNSATKPYMPKIKAA